jgi:glycosyltransferase involved in cell wall biosynthesis
MTNTRAKVLLTDDSLALGGSEMMMLRRLEQLDRTRFEVHLVTLRQRGALLSAARARADHYGCINRRRGLDAPAILRLRKYLTKHAIDLVNTTQWLDSLYVLLASQRLQIRRVATVHGFDITWRHDVNVRVLKHFHRVIGVSRSARLDLFKMGFPWRKLAVVYNSFDSSFRLESDTIIDYDGSRPFRLVMVASFRWAREPSTLVTAMEILRARGINIELSFIGEGDSRLKSACEAMVAAKDLESVVRFCGEMAVTASLLRGFDLFVFASLADAFPVALLEAMACGLPVLVADIPPLMELIQHGRCGYYYEAGNPESCADAVATLIENRDLRRTLARRASERAADFTAAKTTRDLEQVYEEVLETAL